MTDTPYTDEELEAGRKLFAGAVDFVKGVVALKHLPDADRPEIAFAGRSNVGKSSLINALTNRKNLARTSNTPGRTQELNYFNLGEGRFYLVDLPGYGFAEAPKASVDAWSRLTMDYLRGRVTLKRVYLLIDSRRGITEVDKAIMAQFDKAAVTYQTVLTKIDKLKASEIGPLRTATETALKKHPAAHPHVLITSSEKGVGLPELRAEVLKLA
jgi:GTP-binding protein